MKLSILAVVALLTFPGCASPRRAGIGAALVGAMAGLSNGAAAVSNVPATIYRPQMTTTCYRGYGGMLTCTTH